MSEMHDLQAAIGAARPWTQPTEPNKAKPKAAPVEAKKEEAKNDGGNLQLAVASSTTADEIELDMHMTEGAGQLGGLTLDHEDHEWDDDDGLHIAC